MDDKKYISERLENQINWYSKKSTKNKNFYYFFQVVEIFLAASIPIMACFAFSNIIISVIIGIIGGIITVIETVCKMCKYHENWIQYRYISELLKHEKYLYITKTAPYDNEAAFNYLVERAERIISSENVNWVGINSDNLDVKLQPSNN